MLKLCPPLSVAAPREYITALVQLFAAYPPEVWPAAISPVDGCPVRCPALRLDQVKRVLDDAHEPILRDQERRQSELDAKRMRLAAPVRAPRTAEEQARVDDQVAQLRAAFQIPPEGLPKKGSEPMPRPAMADELKLQNLK